MLSPSILDHLINNDRKLPPEYNLPHTYVEMQVSDGPAESAKVLITIPASYQFPHRLFHTHTRAHVNSFSIVCHQQSLQIAAFLFTVCHVVIVVQDWFTDINLYRYVAVDLPSLIGEKERGALVKALTMHGKLLSTQEC